MFFDLLSSFVSGLSPVQKFRPWAHPSMQFEAPNPVGNSTPEVSPTDWNTYTILHSGIAANCDGSGTSSEACSAGQKCQPNHLDQFGRKHESVNKLVMATTNLSGGNNTIKPFDMSNGTQKVPHHRNHTPVWSDGSRDFLAEALCLPGT